MASNYPPLPPGQPVPGAQGNEYPPPGTDPQMNEVYQGEGAPPEMPVEAGKGRTPLVIGGMVVALIVIGAAVFFLFGRGEETAPTTTAGAGPRGTAPARPGETAKPASPGQAGTPASPVPSLDPGLSADVSESYQQYSARNPFKCTFACPEQQTSSTTTSGSSSSGSSTPSPAPQGGTTSGTQQPASSSSLSLTEILRDGSTQKAIVKVNGSTYTVGVGETFAGNYKLTKISGSCASFLQGDSPFTLCSGQSVLK